MPSLVLKLVLVLADWVWRVGEAVSGEAEEGEAGRPGRGALAFLYSDTFLGFLCFVVLHLCIFIFRGRPGRGEGGVSGEAGEAFCSVQPLAVGEGRPGSGGWTGGGDQDQQAAASVPASGSRRSEPPWLALSPEISSVDEEFYSSLRIPESYEAKRRSVSVMPDC